MSSPGKKQADDNDSDKESWGIVSSPENSSSESNTKDDSPPSHTEQHSDPPSNPEPNQNQDNQPPEAGKAEEDPVEALIEKKLAELKKIQNVSPEEEARIRDKIRKQQSGRWLQDKRASLAGKKTVPIEDFDRLVAENESAIGFVAKNNARFESRLHEKDEKIRELQQKLDDGHGHGQNEQHDTTGTQTSDAGTQTSATDDQAGENASALLQQESDNLKDKLKKCEVHGTRADAKIRELEEAVAAAKADHNTYDKDRIREEMRRRITMLEADLKTARETGTRHYGRVQELEQARRDGLAREQGLKDDVRKSEKDVKDLQKECRRLMIANRAAALTAPTTTTAGPATAPVPDTGDEAAAQKKQIDDLQQEVRRLKKRIGDNVAAAAPAPGTEAAAQQKQIDDLTKTLASRKRRIKELAEAKRDLEARQLNWMGGHVYGRATTEQFGPNNPSPMWLDTGDTIIKAKQDLDIKVVALFERLGFENDEELDAEAVVRRIGETLDEEVPLTTGIAATRGGKGNGNGNRNRNRRNIRPLPLNVLRLAGETTAALRLALAAGKRVEDLEAQQPPTDEDHRAQLAAAKMKEEEIDRRLETQYMMHRNHRGAFIASLVGADQELQRVAAAAAAANHTLRDAIDGVRQKYLVFGSWPDPDPSLYMPQNQRQLQNQMMGMGRNRGF